MELQISFKSGDRQAQQAARYFNEAVGFLVDTMVEELEQQEFLISGNKDTTLRLRIWSRKSLTEDELHAILDRILIVRNDLVTLQEGPADPQRLAPLATDWLSGHFDGEDLFVELAIADPGSSEDPRPEFSMGLLRGRSVLISTDTVLFTWLQENVFGLTVSGHGSYLLELRDGPEKQWQKAS